MLILSITVLYMNITRDKNWDLSFFKIILRIVGFPIYVVTTQPEYGLT